jgi:ankyrin repeat protein
MVTTSICLPSVLLHILGLLSIPGKSANTDKMNILGRTALMEACARGRLSLAHLLVKASADLILEDESGKTAKDWAYWASKLEQNDTRHLEPNVYEALEQLVSY